MSIVTYDTCIFIKYKPLVYPRGFRLSAVVLHELTVGANDDRDVGNFESKLRQFEKDKRLITPNGEDWFLSGKVLNSLQRVRKAANKGKTPKISAEESRRIMRDVLIARTARRENALLVTDNVADFEKISAFCKVRIVTGKEFFGT